MDKAFIESGNKALDTFVKDSNLGLYYTYVTYSDKEHWHDSWRWLMQVVEFINNLEENETCYSVHLCADRVFLHRQGEPMETFRVKECGGTLIGATFQACVRFAQWHNHKAKKGVSNGS